jgi:hypothetical protein
MNRADWSPGAERPGWGLVWKAMGEQPHTDIYCDGAAVPASVSEEDGAAVPASVSEEHSQSPHRRVIAGTAGAATAP